MPGIYVDHLSNRIRDMFESNRITSCNPNNRHNENPWLVIREIIEVPLKVNQVASQYIAIENTPTNQPFCDKSGFPIIYAIEAAANPSTVGYQTTF